SSGTCTSLVSGTLPFLTRFFFFSAASSGDRVTLVFDCTSVWVEVTEGPGMSVCTFCTVAEFGPAPAGAVAPGATDPGGGSSGPLTPQPASTIAPTSRAIGSLVNLLAVTATLSK